MSRLTLADGLQNGDLPDAEKGQNAVAVFSGTLGPFDAPSIMPLERQLTVRADPPDITTLGGAGFASQKYTYSPPLILPSSQFMGIRLHILPGTGKASLTSSPSTPRSFTVTIATTPATKLPNGRTASRVSWEADFEGVDDQIRSDVDPLKTAIITLPFSSFTPTYRGRPVPRFDPKSTEAAEEQDQEKDRNTAVASADDSTTEAKQVDDKEDDLDASALPFHTEHIHECGLMCRSGFGKQEGEFCLRIVKVEAVPATEDETHDPASRQGGWLSRLLCFL